MATILSLSRRQEVIPRQVASGDHRDVLVAPTKQDDVLDPLVRELEGGIDDLLQAHVRALAVGHVGGDDQPGTARSDPVSERPGAEPREHDGVNRADPGRREHDDHRLGAERHVHRQAVTDSEPERAQAGRDPLDLVTELCVREHAALAALVGVDKRGMPAAAAPYVVVEALPGNVRLRAGEPAKRGRVGLEDRIPASKPRQLGRRPRPESFRIRLAVLDHAPDKWVDEIHTRDSNTPVPSCR